MLAGKGNRSSVRDALRRGFAGVTFAALLVATSVVGAKGDELQLDDYHGKVVVLDFWASWCIPCRRSFPWMNEMQKKYGDDGLVIIAVNLDTNISDARKFLAKYPAEFQVSYDQTRELARQFEVEAMPSSFLIDRRGEVVERHLGFRSAKTGDYEVAIIAALQLK